jgi:DNA-directed RNA polymerase specialized sigma24 family protein
MPSQFPTTRWSLIARASRESAAGSRDQMGELLAHYWRPMLIHLRYKGLSNESAEDVLQDFMVELLDQDLLSVADPQKGRFRSLLLTALDRFLVSRVRYQQAAKRSPGALASLDAAPTDIAPANTTEAALVFERAWALDVLAEALARIERECAETGETARWEIFQERMVVPLISDAPEADYSALAARFGLESGKAAMNLLVTAKRQFARLLREVIREYVNRSPSATKPVDGVSGQGGATMSRAIDGVDLNEHLVRQTVERELADLQQVLSRSRGVAEAVGSLQQTEDADNPAKSRYWRLLTERANESDWWSALFSAGSEVNDDALSAGCAEILQRSLANVPDCNDATGQTIGAVLRSEHPSLDVLKALKQWFNLQRFSPARDVPAPLANGLYLLVLAVALVKCGQRITGLADAQFRAGLEWLAAQPWLDEDLQRTVHNAQSALPQ